MGLLGEKKVEQEGEREKKDIYIYSFFFQYIYIYNLQKPCLPVYVIYNSLLSYIAGRLISCLHILIVRLSGG